MNLNKNTNTILRDRLFTAKRAAYHECLNIQHSSRIIGDKCFLRRNFNLIETQFACTLHTHAHTKSSLELVVHLGKLNKLVPSIVTVAVFHGWLCRRYCRRHR